MKQIVEYLDAGAKLLHILSLTRASRALTDGNGFMDPSEVKVLIAKITGLPVAAIPDDHHEVSPHPLFPAGSPIGRKLWHGTA